MKHKKHNEETRPATCGQASIQPVGLPANQDIRNYFFYSEDEDSTDSTDDSENAWTEKPEFPSPNEVMGLELFDDDGFMPLPPNIISGPWPSKEAYLRSHYELLREDAVAPLRDAVAYVRENPRMMDSPFASIYEKVYIAGVTIAHRGVGFRVHFSTRRAGKNIVWDYSKRLISGSIVALSPAEDCFKCKCVIAVVAARPLDGVKKQPPEIDIFFARAEDAEFDPHKEWIMVECRNGYYEASRHTMTAMQKMANESFPLADHICSLDTEIDAPQYIKEEPDLEIQSAVEGTKMQNMVNVLDDWPNSPMGDLDTTQWEALKEILTKRLAIIQGPPGTGKTFVSVIALRVLLQNMGAAGPPIIVAAQTNHALDQLLTHVAHFEHRYIRIGGRSNDPEIRKRTLYAIRKTSPPGTIAGGLLVPSLKEFQGLSKMIAERLSSFNQEDDATILPVSVFAMCKVLSEEQCRSLVAGAKNWTHSGKSDNVDPMMIWLGHQAEKFEVKYKNENFGFKEDEIDLQYEQLKELEADQGLGDDEYDYLKGQYLCIREGLRGRETVSFSNATIQGYLRCRDMWTIPTAARGNVYNVLRSLAKEKLAADIRKLVYLYKLNAENLQIGKWERDYFVLRDAKVIGMTTTGLSKYRGLISSLNPKVIVIEEAAEVIEAPIAAACFKSLEHLILVGDHKQLKGTCAVQDLTGEPFYLNISMFERLVHNGLHYITLRRQRRMAPEMRRLLEPIYGELHDHPSVLQRPSIPGMGDVNSFFFSHVWGEASDSLSSKINEMEAQMIVGFFVYLAMNGVPVTDITVLTFYNGQRKRLLKLLKQHPYLQGFYVNVATVDSYQGEENEVVILSLVRSGGNIGFLSVENRACVALSRAKRGFYIFGNAESVAFADPLWWEIISIMGNHERPENRRLGFNLPLTCVKHGNKTFIQNPEDFGRTNGGCNHLCDEILDCGHKCPSFCHAYPHEQVLCTGSCRNTMPCGHTCDQPCSRSHACRCKCTLAATLVPAKEKRKEPAKAKKKAEPPLIPDLDTEDTVTMHDSSRHQEMVQKYQDFANGGVKEHDQRLFAAAQIEQMERQISGLGIAGQQDVKTEELPLSPKTASKHSVRAMGGSDENRKPAQSIPSGKLIETDLVETSTEYAPGPVEKPDWEAVAARNTHRWDLQPSLLD